MQMVDHSSWSQPGAGDAVRYKQQQDAKALVSREARAA